MFTQIIHKNRKCGAPCLSDSRLSQSRAHINNTPHPLWICAEGHDMPKQGDELIAYPCARRICEIPNQG